MKNRLCMLAAVLFALISTAVPVHAMTDVVEDEAQILSAEQEQELKDYGIRLFNATTAEFAVRTVYTLGDEPVEEYAVRKFRELKLGHETYNNGVLLIVSTEPEGNNDRKFYVSVGYGLEGALPDGKVGRIIDEIAMPYLRAGEPDLAVMEAYKAFYNEIAAEYGLDGDELPVDYPEYEGEGFGIPTFIIVIIVIYLIYTFLRGGGGNGPRGRSGGGGPIFFPPSGGSRGGGGGFGGFGGGGSTGGGGAGRSW